MKKHIAFGELDVAGIKLCQEIQLEKQAEVRPQRALNSLPRISLSSLGNHMITLRMEQQRHKIWESLMYGLNLKLEYII